METFAPKELMPKKGQFVMFAPLDRITDDGYTVETYSCYGMYDYENHYWVSTSGRIFPNAEWWAGLGCGFTRHLYEKYGNLVALAKIGEI